MENQYAPPQANVADVAQAGGVITAGMVEAMRGTKPWVLLIGILLFLGAAFSALGGLAAMAGMAVVAGARGGAPTAMLVGMGVVYLIVSVIYVFLGVYLVKYSSAIGRLVANGQGQDMEDALQSQRKFWKLSGVLAMIMIVFVVLGIIAAIAIPTIMGFPR